MLAWLHYDSATSSRGVCQGNGVKAHICDYSTSANKRLPNIKPALQNEKFIVHHARTMFRIALIMQVWWRLLSYSHKGLGGVCSKSLYFSVRHLF